MLFTKATPFETICASDDSDTDNSDSDDAVLLIGSSRPRRLRNNRFVYTTAAIWALWCAGTVLTFCGFRPTPANGTVHIIACICMGIAIQCTTAIALSGPFTDLELRMLIIHHVCALVCMGVIIIGLVSDFPTLCRVGAYLLMYTSLLPLVTFLHTCLLDTHRTHHEHSP